MNFQILKKLGVVCALALVFLGASSADAFATHFRYGTITYRIPNPNQPNVIEFKAEFAFRRSFGWSPANPVVGNVVSLGDTLDIYNASNTLVAAPQLSVVVSYVNAAEDYFIGTATVLVTVPMPSTTSVYRAVYQNCCRISTLRDSNNDRDYYVWTTFEVNPSISATRNRVPVSSSVPVIYAAVNAARSVQLSAVDPDGDPITFRLATTTESGLVNPKPLTPVAGQPGAFALSSSGLMTWTPTVIGLYSVQVVITDSHGAASVLDVLLQVVANAGSFPTLKLNNSTAPLTLSVPAGSTVQVALQATDPDPAVGTTNVPTPITLGSGAQPQGSVVNPLLPTTLVSPANATFTWTPSFEDVGSHVIIFSATDDRGLQTTNSVTVNVASVPVLFVQGVRRDFTNATPDFNKADGDNGVALVLATLDGAGKPVLNNAVTHTTIASTASFANWWAGPGSVSTATLSALAADPSVFTMTNTDFGAGNQFFTWEGHTRYTYGPGQQITFRSSDDMWVFLNGRLIADLGGVHVTPKSFLVTFDALAASLGLRPGESYPLDIFYAHRSGTHGNTVGIGTSDSPVCSPIGAPSAVSLTSLTRTGQAIMVGNVLRLAGTGSALAGGAWIAGPSLAMAPGFRMAFDFRMTPLAGQTSEGLAVVFQAAVPPSLGSSGAGLGYSGLVNSVAVEFDAHQDLAAGDPAYDHVSVHTNGGSPNSELETLSLARSTNSIDVPSGTPFTLDDGLQHRAVLEYSTNDLGQGVVRVYLDNSPVPLATATLSSAVTAAVFGDGRAYVGLTSSSASGVQSNVEILNLTTSSVGVSADTTSVVSLPQTILPGQTGTVTVQARDACNARIYLGGQGAGFTAAMTSDGYTTPVTMTDLQDGTYRFSYTPVVGGLYTLDIKYAGIAIRPASLTALVLPATPIVSVTGGAFAYNGAPRSATGTATGVLGEDLGPLAFTYDGAAAAPADAGTYAVVGTFTDNTHYATTAATASLEITRVTPTVTVGGGPFTFDGNAHAATGTVTGLGGADLGAPTLTYDGNAAAPVNAATYAVIASFAESTNYTAATATGSITIAPATPAVVVSGGPFTFDATPHAATVTVTGVNGADLGSAALTYNGSATAPTDAGTYAVAASFSGGGNYTSAAGSGSITIAPATPTVTVGGGPFTYDAQPHAATGAVTGVNGAALGSPSFTYDGSSTAPIDAKTYAVSASFAAGGNYTAATATGSITIAPATPAVTVGGGPFTYDGNPHGATGAVTGVGGVDLGTPSFTYNGSPAAPSNAGDYAVIGSFAGGGNYTGASATATLTIGKATPIVSWAAPASIVYGTALSGQLNATTPVAGSFVYAPAAGAVLGAGTRTLSATFTPADPANYENASSSVALLVTPAPLAITANDATKVYGEPAPAFSAGYSGFVNGDGPASLAGTLAFSGAATTATGVGTYAITPGGVSSPNYAIAFGHGTFSVTPAPLTITANNRTKVLGQAITFAGTEFAAAGLRPGDAVTSVTLSSPGAPASAGLGGSPYVITPSAAAGPALGNYAITYVNGTLTVVPNTTIASLTPSVKSLWPVNGKMVALTVAVALENPNAFSPVCTITGVTSNEPAGKGGDWIITPNSLSLSLRADRLGSGSGRVYTIAVTCTDPFGNTSSKTTTVAVPHDQGK